MEEDANFDIYGDLPQIDFEKEAENLRIEVNEQSENIKSLVEKINLLSKEKTKLLKQNKVLQKNISILLKTAKLELSRKERSIGELRQQLQKSQWFIETNINQAYQVEQVTVAVQTEASVIDQSEFFCEKPPSPPVSTQSDFGKKTESGSNKAKKSEGAEACKREVDKKYEERSRENDRNCRPDRGRNFKHEEISRSQRERYSSRAGRRSRSRSPHHQRKRSRSPLGYPHGSHSRLNSPRRNAYMRNHPGFRRKRSPLRKRIEKPRPEGKRSRSPFVKHGRERSFSPVEIKRIERNRTSAITSGRKSASKPQVPVAEVSKSSSMVTKDDVFFVKDSLVVEEKPEIEVLSVVVNDGSADSADDKKSPAVSEHYHTPIEDEKEEGEMSDSEEFQDAEEEPVPQLSRPAGIPETFRRSKRFRRKIEPPSKSLFTERMEKRLRLEAERESETQHANIEDGRAMKENKVESNKKGKVLKIIQDGGSKDNTAGIEEEVEDAQVVEQRSKENISGAKRKIKCSEIKENKGEEDTADARELRICSNMNENRRKDRTSSARRSIECMDTVENRNKGDSSSPEKEGSMERMERRRGNKPQQKIDAVHLEEEEDEASEPMKEGTKTLFSMRMERRLRLEAERESIEEGSADKGQTVGRNSVNIVNNKETKDKTDDKTLGIPTPDVSETVKSTIQPIKDKIQHRLPGLLGILSPFKNVLKPALSESVMPSCNAHPLEDKKIPDTIEIEKPPGTIKEQESVYRQFIPGLGIFSPLKNSVSDTEPHSIVETFSPFKNNYRLIPLQPPQPPTSQVAMVNSMLIQDGGSVPLDVLTSVPVHLLTSIIKNADSFKISEGTSVANSGETSDGIQCYVIRTDEPTFEVQKPNKPLSPKDIFCINNTEPTHEVTKTNTTDVLTNSKPKESNVEESEKSAVEISSENNKGDGGKIINKADCVVIDSVNTIKAVNSKNVPPSVDNSCSSEPLKNIEADHNVKDNGSLKSETMGKVPNLPVNGVQKPFDITHYKIPKKKRGSIDEIAKNLCNNETGEKKVENKEEKKGSSEVNSRSKEKTKEEGKKEKKNFREVLSLRERSPRACVRKMSSSEVKTEIKRESSSKKGKAASQKGKISKPSDSKNTTSSSRDTISQKGIISGACDPEKLTNGAGERLKSPSEIQKSQNKGKDSIKKNASGSKEIIDSSENGKRTSNNKKAVGNNRNTSRKSKTSPKTTEKKTRQLNFDEALTAGENKKLIEKEKVCSEKILETILREKRNSVNEKLVTAPEEIKKSSEKQDLGNKEEKHDTGAKMPIKKDMNTRKRSPVKSKIEVAKPCVYEPQVEDVTTCSKFSVLPLSIVTSPKKTNETETLNTNEKELKPVEHNSSKTSSDALHSSSYLSSLSESGHSPSWQQPSVNTDIANFEIFKSVNLSSSTAEKSGESNRLSKDLDLSESDEESYESDSSTGSDSDLSAVMNFV